MHIISVSNFGLWKNTEERGVEDSRSAKTTGVYCVFFWLHLARTRHTIQPVRIDEPRYKILRTSQCSSMHPSLKAKLTRSDATDVRQRAPMLRKSDADRRAPESAKSQDQGCPSIRVGIGDCTTNCASHDESADACVWLVRCGRGFEVETLVNFQAHVDEGCAGHIARRWTGARDAREHPRGTDVCGRWQLPASDSSGDRICSILRILGNDVYNTRINNINTNIDVYIASVRYRSL